MVTQISMSIVIIFALIIGISLIILIVATPYAVKEYKIYLNKKSKENFLTKSSLSIFMEELSRCVNKAQIDALLKKIYDTALDIYEVNPDSLPAKNAQSVLSWLEKFSVDRHIEDFKKLRYSSQIRYDKKKRDFKLMLPSANKTRN